MGLGAPRGRKRNIAGKLSGGRRRRIGLAPFATMLPTDTSNKRNLYLFTIHCYNSSCARRGRFYSVIARWQRERGYKSCLIKFRLMLHRLYFIVQRLSETEQLRKQKCCIPILKRTHTLAGGKLKMHTLYVAGASRRSRTRKI